MILLWFMYKSVLLIYSSKRFIVSDLTFRYLIHFEKREGRGERSVKSLVPYQLGHSGQLSTSGGDQGQKGPSCARWVWSIGRQAGPWVPGVVRMSVSAKKSPCQSRHLLQEGGPLPGPETGLLSNTRKWIVRGDTCADKARDFIGKGHPGGEQ